MIKHSRSRMAVKQYGTKHYHRKKLTTFGPITERETNSLLAMKILCYRIVIAQHDMCVLVDFFTVIRNLFYIRSNLIYRTYLFRSSDLPILPYRYTYMSQFHQGRFLHYYTGDSHSHQHLHNKRTQHMGLISQSSNNYIELASKTVHSGY